jgi:hypothetical protein
MDIFCEVFINPINLDTRNYFPYQENLSIILQIQYDITIAFTPKTMKGIKEKILFYEWYDI